MEKLDVLAQLERGEISFDEAVARISEPPEALGPRPIWRLRLKIGGHGFWLPWPPIAILAAVLLVAAGLIMEIVKLFNKEICRYNLWKILAFLVELSFTGGGLVIDVESDESKVYVEM